MRLQGAFHVPDHPKHGLLRIHPSSKRLPPYMTGGLQLLYNNIDKRVKPERHALGAHTDEKGRFKPQKGMSLLGKRYRFVEVIGKGQSSISIKAADTYCDDKLVAVKVLHQHNYTLGFQESDCIRRLNTADPFCLSPTFRMHTTFCYDGHYCMVFELLRPEPLHSYFKHVEDSEKLDKIRQVTVQLLKALGFLQQQNVLHADLKPENILLSKEHDLNSLKVVDFGNAIHCVHAELSLYYDDFELQTLLYRAPEVMFGQPFGLEADMWSLGCILAELYHGQSLFFAKDKMGVLQKIVEVLGPLPETVFQRGKFFSQFRHFTTRTLSPKNSTNVMMNLLRCTNYAFCNFLVRLLTYNPAERLTVAEAACHPFLAPIAGVAYFLPRGSFRGYPQVFLDQKDFAGQPTVAPEIERMALDPISLLKRGTHTTTPPTTRQVAQVTPMQHSHASISSRSTKGHKSSRSVTQGRAFVCEPNNNQALPSLNHPQPRPAHINAGTNSMRRDVEPIDLTQSSPQPLHTNRNLRHVVVSPNSNFNGTDVADERMRLTGQTNQNRKRPRNQIDSSRENNRTSTQKKAPNRPMSHTAQVNERPKQRASKPGNEMFRSWENSMSKYIDKSEDKPRWSDRAGQVVSSAIGRSLGVVPSASSAWQGGPDSLKLYGANNGGEQRSYALQPNQFASKEAKAVDSSQKLGASTLMGTANYSTQQQGKKRSTTVSRSDSAHSGNTSKKSTSKRNLSSEANKTNSDDSKREKIAKERYCPQYSDISNSQSIDENASPRGVTESVLDTNFTSYLHRQNERDFKRSESDINANSLQYFNHVDLAKVSRDSVSGDSESSMTGENSSFMPPKKRKRYRRTSVDENDGYEDVHRSNSSNRNRFSVIVNGVANSDGRDNKKTELKKALLQEKAVLEKKMSKISQRKGATSSTFASSSVESNRFRNVQQQSSNDGSVYDFESDVSRSPVIRPKGMEARNEQNVRKLFGNRTPAKSKPRVPKVTGSGGNNRKKLMAKRKANNVVNLDGMAQENSEAQLPRRMSPRKHPSTARLSGSFEGQPLQNGVKREIEFMDDGSDTSIEESDVLQMTMYTPNGSRNSSPLSNEDEVVLMPV